MRGLKLPDMVELLCHIERARFILPWSETSKVHVLSDLLQPCSFYIELPFLSMMCRREIFFAFSGCCQLFSLENNQNLQRCAIARIVCYIQLM